MTLTEAARLRFLEPTKLQFFKAGATLRLTIQDEVTWMKVAIVRAFPLSMPNGYFSVRDGTAKEIGLLRDLAALDEESRSLIEADLERRYMVAIIHRVLSVKERFGTVEWDVETHRGRCLFTTRDLRENVIRCSVTHFLLTDVENNRYEIPDLDALDPKSQASLLLHL